MLVLFPSNSPAIRILGLDFSFTGGGGVAFPLHHGGVFAFKGRAPSRVDHLAGTKEEHPQPRQQ